MNALIESAAYMPHGYCLLWQPWLVTLHVGADLLIVASYFLIPVALVLFVRRRPDIRQRGIVYLFAAFIMLCGLTHLVSIVTLWVPIYPVQGLVKLATGLVSAATAVVLFSLLPLAVRVPTPAQLEQANASLRAEIDAHLATLAELRVTQASLEEHVARRTAELSETNHRLAVVTREAVHRGKNLISVVSAIARQTAAGAMDTAEFMERFLGRLNALSNATSSVAGEDAMDGHSLALVVRRQLDPVLDTYGTAVELDGPDIVIGNEPAQSIALMVHELATNSLKHGALSGEGGRIDVAWRHAEGPDGAPELHFAWEETLPPGVPAFDPSKIGNGFGTRLLTQLLPRMLNGKVRIDSAGSGLRYELTVPVADLARSGVESDLRDLPGEAFAELA